MNNSLLYGLALVFLLGVLMDILGHRLLKIKRRLAEWFILTVLVGALGITGFTTAKDLLAKDKGGDSSLYLAYRYLLDGNIPLAMSSADRAEDPSGANAQMFKLLAACQSQDYISAYFQSKRMMADLKLDEELLESVEALNGMAADMLGIGYDNGIRTEIQSPGIVDDQESGQERKGAGGSPDGGSDTGESPNGGPDTTESSDQGQNDESIDVEQDTPFMTYDEQYNQRMAKYEALVGREIQNCFDSLDFEDTDRLEELYELHQKVNSGNYADLTLDDVLDAVDTYEGDPDILRMAIQYTAGIKDYEKAVSLAEQLLKEDKTPESYVVLTDVIAQGVMDGYSITSDDDAEKEALLDRVDSLEERAAKLQEGDVEKARLLNRASDLRKQALQLDIHRAINYLEAKKPFLLDTSGMFDIQEAKLYLAVDDRDKAKELIYDVMDSAAVLSEDSPIKEPLLEVIDAYNQSEADKVSPLLPSAVQNLIKAESQDIIKADQSTINGKMANYITSTLKYDKIGIFISKIDTSRYPTVRAYVNVNGEKDGAFGMAGDFKKKDFELIDTQYQMKDFELDTDKGSNTVNIAIVMDVSGSMQGTPLEDAKVAAKACVEHMDAGDQEIAVVAYSDGGSVVTSLTDEADLLINGINSLNIGGGTNIPSGIEAGIGSLSGSRGSRAIILMTDGQDGNTGAMDAAIQNAVANNISIFAVGLGDVNSAYLQDIADRTGGKYMLAANSTELGDIYRTLQKYIVNNYCIKYKVEANPEVNLRNLAIVIPEYQVSGDRDYTLGDASGETSQEADSGIHKVDEKTLVISSVSPNGLSSGDVTAGREITMKGNGFSKEMQVTIGNIKLQNLSVVDGSTLTGRLKGSLASGAYQAKISFPDGRVAIKDQALFVFRAGTTTKVRLGSTLITADSIGQTGDKTFVASGNVMVNGFIHCDAPLTITANELPATFDIASKDTAYLGNTGVLSGTGKLYISYAQVSSGGAVKNTFASLVMGGKDYVVQDGEFRIGIDGTQSDFDMTLHNLDIQIPMMSTIEVAKMKLYADRIQVTINQLSPMAIIDSIKDGVKGSVVSTQKEQAAAGATQKVEKRADAFRFKPLEAIQGSVDLALTADDIKFGLVLTLDASNAIQFGGIGLNKAELKLSSLDPDNEYWKLSGEIDFSKIVKGLGGVGISGLNGHIASYYWCFDEIEITADLYPGIPIYNAVYIDKLGLNLDGASTLILKSGFISDAAQKVLFADQNLDAVKPQDIVLSGIIGADANLFKTFHLKVPEDFTKWGTLGEIDGKISYNFSETQFTAAADLKLLQQKMTNASIGFGKKGLDIAAGLQAELNLLDCGIGGNLDIGLNSTWSVLTFKLGVKGHLDCGFINFHQSGDAGLKFVAEYDGSYYAVELSHDHLISKFWYDSDGKPFIWDRFHAETYME